MPDSIAIAAARRTAAVASARYDTISFAELDHDVTLLAKGLVDMGVRPGDRIVLLVPVGIEFVSLVFALLRSGAVGVLIDPGMGRRSFVDCLASTEPDGFISVWRGHALRLLKRRWFPKARHNVWVGRRRLWRVDSLKSLRTRGKNTCALLPRANPDDPAAIIFTSGSTGPAKGVLYHHKTFASQAKEIQAQYQIMPGGVDLACFAFFGLFNCAMGTTTVFPDIDFSRPAEADPANLLAAANDWKVTQAFASPTVWNRLSQHCQSNGERIDTLSRILSCGAPVPAKLLGQTLACAKSDAKMYTPYGATEAMPIASIEASEVLAETACKTDYGAGICVGRRFGGVEWKIIRITDDPIMTMDAAVELAPSEIGELVVRGPQVTREYVTRVDANRFAKIHDGRSIWHRMGDVGRIDEHDRFWYCGRKSHRVEVEGVFLFTIPCEAVFNVHPRIKRSALIPLRIGDQDLAAIVFELNDAVTNLLGPTLHPELLAELTQLKRANRQLDLVTVAFRHDGFPVDTRHNSKIDREALARWAAATIANRRANLPASREGASSHDCVPKEFLFGRELTDAAGLNDT